VDGKTCAANRDCASGVCSGGLCRTASCSDTVKNGTETDVDCGGTCPADCGTGKMCSSAADCISKVCTSGKCVAPTCSDRVQNGTESDVDCSGGCTKCANGKKCVVGADCTSGRCANGTCAPAWIIALNGGAREYSDGSYATSCYRYKNPADPAYQYSGATGTGLYRILPKTTVVTVWCDMDTDGGGYTFYKVPTSRDTATQAQSYCAGLGMHLFIPRTQAHLRSAYSVSTHTGRGGNCGCARSGDNSYLRIMAIHPKWNGARCVNAGLYKDSPFCDWKAADNGRFWVTDRRNITEPNGDNYITASMYYGFNASGDITWYNDISNPGYNSPFFICDTRDKP